jgi:ATP synthase protein I
MSWIKNRPLSIVLIVQLLITLLVAVACGFSLGWYGAVSAMLGGAVNLVSSAAFAVIVSHHKGYTADRVIGTAIRAEIVKVSLVMILLWIVFKNYESVNVFAFIGTFILTVLAHSAVLLVSDNRENKINQ